MREAVLQPVPQPLKQITMLTNPAAGHGNARHAAERAVARFQQRGVAVTQLVGRDEQDAVRLAREAVERGTDAFVVTGGDGVIALALQAVAQQGVPFGIIPAGTGNDHAREYGIPTGDPEAAVDVVVDGWTETVDLGRVKDGTGAEKWFGSVLASGFDSLVSDRTNRMTWPHGRMRYNLAMLAELAQLRPLPFRMELADGTVIDENVTLVAVGNTRSYGGGMKICPDADHTDGLLDVTVIRSGPRRRLMLQFPSVFKGTHVRSPDVDTYRTESLRIESPGINAYADGDYVGPLPVFVEAVPAALSFFRPARTRRVLP